MIKILMVIGSLVLFGFVILSAFFEQLFWVGVIVTGIALVANIIMIIKHTHSMHSYSGYSGNGPFALQLAICLISLAGIPLGLLVFNMNFFQSCILTGAGFTLGVLVTIMIAVFEHLY